MFRISIRLLYQSSCPGVLSSLRIATVKRTLPQVIIDAELFNVQDPHGYNSLARTLAFRHPCGAVSYNKSSKELLLSFNSHSEDFTRIPKAQKFLLSSMQGVIDDYLKYFNDSSNKESLKGLINLIISKSHAYPLFTTSAIPNEAKRLDNSGIAQKKFTTVLKHIKDEILKLKVHGGQQSGDFRFFELYLELVASFKYSPIKVKEKYIQEVLQPLCDIVKVCKLFTSQPLSYKELPNPHMHHAELAILKHYKANKVDLKDVKIGISKLTCAVCHTVLEHHKVEHIGPHGKIYVEHYSQVLDDFFSDDDLCLKACNVLDKYIDKNGLRDTVKSWRGLKGVETKLSHPVWGMEYIGESYLLDFDVYKSDIEKTVNMLGIEMPESVI